jgi:hypothetical protein
MSLLDAWRRLLRRNAGIVAIRLWWIPLDSGAGTTGQWGLSRKHPNRPIRSISASSLGIDAGSRSSRRRSGERLRSHGRPPPPVPLLHSAGRRVSLPARPCFLAASISPSSFSLGVPSFSCWARSRNGAGRCTAVRATTLRRCGQVEPDQSRGASGRPGRRQLRGLRKPREAPSHADDWCDRGRATIRPAPSIAPPRRPRPDGTRA